jgi:hypothetical protein
MCSYLLGHYIFAVRLANHKKNGVSICGATSNKINWKEYSITQDLDSEKSANTDIYSSIKAVNGTCSLGLDDTRRSHQAAQYQKSSWVSYQISITDT